MKRKSNILLIILIISSLFLMFIPKSVKGSIADISYSFENDILYNSTNIPSDNTFNLKSSEFYTENYTASYSFNNEIGLKSINISFIDLETSYDGGTEVINDSDGHFEVIQFQDDITGGENPITQHNFTQRTSGIFEYWMRTNNGLGYWQISMMDDLTTCERLRVAGNDIWYTNTVPAWVNIQAFNDDTWYHLKFEWRADNTWDLYINEVLVVNNIALENNQVAGLTHIQFYAGGSVADYLYIDAFGQSWDTNYTINDNITPIIEVDLTNQEVDKYEYALSQPNTLYPRFSNSYPSGWTEIEDGDGLVYVDSILDPDYNREITLMTDGVSVLSFYKSDFVSTSNFINITTSLFIVSTVAPAPNKEWFFIIDASDGGQITALYIDLATLNLYYDYGGLQLLRNDLAYDTLYEFNMFINYDIDVVILLYYIDGVFSERFSYPLDVGGKNGLQRIEYNIISDGNSHVLIDYTGVYENGKSINNEFGYQVIDLNSLKAWDFRDNNLFTINANGYIHLGGVQGVYITEATMGLINPFQNYNNVSYFFNIYDSYVATFTDPQIVMTIQGKNFYINDTEILIEGAKLVQGSNEYFLEFDHGGIEIDTSYFYVDDNKLQFTLITNDTDTEYIQATFDIPNLSSTDRAISFRGFRTNKAFGYFVVDYLAGITTVDIPVIEKTSRTILPTNKTIDTLLTLITDNDVDDIIGTTEGYVSQPILLSISGIGLPILTAGLIEMMIPLIMIIIPTLLISQGFGKEGKKLIIPLFFIFSLITTITLIIPIWIFFIILFGTALFLAKNKEIGVE